jgi:hypothetical protein
MKTTQPFRLIIVHCLAALLLVSCATPAAAPTISAVTVAPRPATATASPTDTPIPPTDTPMPSDTPTSTATATFTSTPTASPTATASATATRLPPTKTPRPKGTNTPLPALNAHQFLTSAGQGVLFVTNLYAVTLTFTIEGANFTIPGGTQRFRIGTFGPGAHEWSAVIPGTGQGRFSVIIMQGFDTMLVFKP